jgi:hypothetical protein
VEVVGELLTSRPASFPALLFTTSFQAWARRRGHLPEARLVSVTDALLTGPEFGEALRASCKDVVAAQ